MDDKLILHGIYSVRDTKSNINHFYAIILSKNENADYDTYLLECVGYPSNKQIHTIISKLLKNSQLFHQEFLSMGQEQILKSVDGYVGKMSEELCEELWRFGYE